MREALAIADIASAHLREPRILFGQSGVRLFWLTSLSRVLSSPNRRQRIARRCWPRSLVSSLFMRRIAAPRRISPFRHPVTAVIVSKCSCWPAEAGSLIIFTRRRLRYRAALAGLSSPGEPIIGMMPTFDAGRPSILPVLLARLVAAFGRPKACRHRLTSPGPPASILQQPAAIKFFIASRHRDEKAVFASPCRHGAIPNGSSAISLLPARRDNRQAR